MRYKTPLGRSVDRAKEMKFHILERERKKKFFEDVEKAKEEYNERSKSK